MNLFDKLVSQALQNQPELAALRVVVEKELLHHDILRTLSDNGLTKNLTFIGGTCLRCCYGGVRLSEDIYFTGGADLTRDSLHGISEVLIESLQSKYGLKVTVSAPVKDSKNVDTWKIKIETRPGSGDIPHQRINIDICALPSYEKRPMMLINPYGVDMGTSGLIMQAQSREEIYSDKLVAFAFRPNRIKHRDIWDIVWLNGKGIKPRLELIFDKLKDRGYSVSYFLDSFDERMKLMLTSQALIVEFKQEMQRFLPLSQMDQGLGNDNFWNYAAYLMEDLSRQMHRVLLRK